MGESGVVEFAGVAAGVGAGVADLGKQRPVRSGFDLFDLLLGRLPAPTPVLFGGAVDDLLDTFGQLAVALFQPLRTAGDVLRGNLVGGVFGGITVHAEGAVEDDLRGVHPVAGAHGLVVGVGFKDAHENGHEGVAVVGDGVDVLLGVGDKLRPEGVVVVVLGEGRGVIEGRGRAEGVVQSVVEPRDGPGHGRAVTA